MNRSNTRVILFGIICAICVIGLFLLIVHKGPTSHSLGDVTVDKLKDSFTYYTYNEQHGDGSMMTIHIYSDEESYVGFMQYYDTHGAAYFETMKLSENIAKQFEANLDDFHLASDETDEELDTGFWSSASLVFGKDGSDVKYVVEPFDISGYGFTNPWTEDVNIVVELPKEADVFDTDVLKDVLVCESDTDLSAYVSMIYMQITEYCEDIQAVVIDKNLVVDDKYAVQVINSENEVTNLLLSSYGYVTENVEKSN